MRSLRELFKTTRLNGETRHALRQFNLGMMRPGKIQSVSELAEWLKVDIHQVDLPIKFAGRLIADPFSDSGYAIEVNKRHSVVSRRFTVLHELGHFLLHVDRSDPLFEPMNLNRGDEEFYFEEKQEREANDFADVVMFGDGALEAAITLLNNDDVKVARYFGVSEAMVVVAKRKFRLGN